MLQNNPKLKVERWKIYSVLFMTLKNAVKAIEQQKKKLEQGSIADSLWFTQTNSFFENIFGANSKEIETLNKYHDKHIWNHHPEFYNVDVAELIVLLINAIETVKLRGVYTVNGLPVESKRNYTKIGAIWTIIGVGVAIAIYLINLLTSNH